MAADDVRKQFIFAVFFKRLFKDPDSKWMLLGGNALLIRTGSGRFTQDIDLSQVPVWEDLGDVVQEIEQLVAGDNDGLSFRITRAEAHSEPDAYGYGTKTAKLYVTAYLYMQEFDRFSIDITSRRHVGSSGAAKVDNVIADPRYADLTRLWAIYQAVISAYDNPSRLAGREALASLIDALDKETAKAIPELKTLAKTLRRRRDDILAYFTHPFSSNGPTEAINGRLEHLRGIALGFRSLNHYITRSLLHTDGFKTKLQRLL